MEPLIRAAVPRRTALRLELPDEVPPIEADVAQFRQALMNVLLNAAEAIGAEAGEIGIRVQARRADRAYLAAFPSGHDLPEGDYVAVEVRDNGPGMDAATLQRLFDPFFTTKFAGRGLGLPAVLGILRGHHGAVKAESAPGQGSTFTLLFPVAAPPAAREGAPPAAAAPAGTVLIVDDEESVVRVARRMLEQGGFRVLTAHDARAAADAFWAERAAIDAVILDLAMPALGGEEVFLVLRNIRADVPVLLASGFSEDEARRRFGERNVDGFIQKPFRAADLLAALRRVLAARRPEGG
jgi:two-component system, cell cycle sensor histidine kinase and response regulator CckA